MNSTPGLDEVFAVMTRASSGDMNARVAIKKGPVGEDPGTRFAVALNHLLDDFSRRTEELKASEGLRRSDDERRTLLAHLVKAQEEERKRIASDVHDDSIQVMAAVGVRLGMLRSTVTDASQLGWITKLEEAVQISIGRLRHLLFQLAPPALDMGGLAAAIRTYLDEAFDGAHVECTLESLIRSEPVSETRTLVYRIAQEALRNVRKHANAGRVQVRLEDKNDGLFVWIRDDGVGCSPTESETPQLGHLGLLSMRERAEMLGGWFRITGVPEEGTTVEFWVPHQEAAEESQELPVHGQVAGVVA